MSNKCLVFVICIMVLLGAFACSKKSQEVFVLRGYPLDIPEGIISQSDDRVKLQIDPHVTADGNGSLKITATEPTVVRLFEVGDVDVENARLIYQAKLRTQGVEGQVYLEMWCHFPEKGDFFSRGLETPLMGTVDWTTAETPFFLKKGENPDNVKLNLVIDGTGTAWIDDIRLLKEPLQ